MIRIHRGLCIAVLGIAVPATGVSDAAAAGGFARGGGGGVAARAFVPPRRVGPVQPPRRVGLQPPRRVEGPFRRHDPRRRIDGLVAPLYGYGLGYGYAPGYGGVIVVLPQAASASEPPPRIACKPRRETFEVRAEGGGTRKVSVTRCAGE